MDFNAFQQVMLPAIDVEIRRFVLRSDLEPFDGLFEMLAYHLGLDSGGPDVEIQGKRIRPLLLLLCTAACGSDWRPALPAAAGVELLHNFSLIHDDIEDNSTTRRGRQTLWARWGSPLAINAGDALFNLAYSAIGELKNFVSAEDVLEAYDIFGRACLELTGGQHLDISYENATELPIDSYWPMVAGKTAALLSCCAELGALVGRADSQRREAFRQFGWNLGLAFQVKDDWLGIWGDAALTGKSVESDLASGKKTLPILYGLQQKDSDFAKWWVEGRPDTKEISSLAESLASTGADEYTRQQADLLTQNALNALERASTHNDASSVLNVLAGSLLARNF